MSWRRPCRQGDFWGLHLASWLWSVSMRHYVTCITSIRCTEVSHFALSSLPKINLNRALHFCRHSKLPRRSRRCQLTKPTHRPSFGGKESFASHGGWHGGRAVVWRGMQTTRKFRLKRYTSPKTNIAPEKWLSKKESSRPTMIFHWLC